MYNKAVLKLLALTLIAAALLGLVAGCGGSSSEGSLEEQREAFLQWEREVTSLHQIADEASVKHDEILAALGAGEIDEYEAYSEISDVKKIIDNAWHNLSKVEAGESLSQERIKQLNAAMSDLTTGLYSKIGGMEKVLEFLDDQKPSLIEEAQDKFKMANSFMMDGIGKYIEVKVDLGLE